MSKVYTVYGSDDCVFTERCKDMIDEYGYEWEYVDIEIDTEVAEEIVEAHCVDEFPQVFDGEQYVGGLDDLEAHLDGLD